MAAPDAPRWRDYSSVFTNAKAGMDYSYRSKEEIQRVVYEASVGSAHFENEQRKEASTLARINEMKARKARLSASDLAHARRDTQRLLVQAEAGRCLTNTWLHVDMDAFFAAVETLDHPEYQAVPMAVGGIGMISTANYEARKYGVRSAMPGFIALKLCPNLVFVGSDFGKYKRASDQVRAVLEEYDAKLCMASLDEAYLNITEACQRRGVGAAALARELRERVHQRTGLTCSAGVAPNRMLAKVCSDINKPNGQYVLPSDRQAVVQFVSTLPVRKIGGVGKVSERVLEAVFGIKCCGDILPHLDELYCLHSTLSFNFFLRTGLGIGGEGMPEAAEGVGRKGISVERTFGTKHTEPELTAKLDEIVHSLSKQMKEKELRGRTVTLKIKDAAFVIRTRARTLSSYTNSEEIIMRTVRSLLAPELAHCKKVGVRLLGVRLSSFSVSDKHGAASHGKITSFTGPASDKQPATLEEDNPEADRPCAPNVEDLAMPQAAEADPYEMEDCASSPEHEGREQEIPTGDHHRSTLEEQQQDDLGETGRAAWQMIDAFAEVEEQIGATATASHSMRRNGNMATGKRGPGLTAVRKLSKKAARPKAGARGIRHTRERTIEASFGRFESGRRQHASAPAGAERVAAQDWPCAGVDDSIDASVLEELPVHVRKDLLVEGVITKEQYIASMPTSTRPKADHGAKPPKQRSIHSFFGP